MRLYCLLATVSQWLEGAVSQHISTGGAGAEMAWEPLGLVQYPVGHNIAVLSNNNVSNDRTYTDLGMSLYQRENMTISPKPKPEGIIMSPNKNKNVNKRHWLPTAPEVENVMYLNYNKNKVSNPINAQAIGKDHGKKTHSVPFERRSSHLVSDMFDQRSAEHMEWQQGFHAREPSSHKLLAGNNLRSPRKNQLLHKSLKLKRDSKYSDVLRLRHMLPASPIRIYSLRKNFAEALKTLSVAFDSQELLPFKVHRSQKFIEFDLKKGGKRKVKFSSWPGKKFPPIIGPLWTPSKQAMKDRNLNKIKFIKNPNILR